MHVSKKSWFRNIRTGNWFSHKYYNFEKIRFTLDNQVVAVAHTAGGERGCEFGPVIKKYLIEQPYKLLKRTKHKLEVFFTTNDPLFHKDCFYQVNLNFN
jgi:hypothetical protein